MNFKFFVNVVGISIVAFILSFIFYLLSGNAFVYENPKILHHLSARISDHENQNPVSFVGINTVVIKAINMNINIKSAKSEDRGKLDVIEGWDKQSFRVVNNYEKMIITQNAAVQNADTSMTIAIPSNVKNIIVQTVSGDVRLAKMNLNDVDISTVHGDINIQEGELQKVSLQTMSGHIHSSAKIHLLAIKSASGDVDSDINIPEPHYQIDTTAGDVNLHAKTIINANFTLHSVAGEVINKAKIAITAKTPGTITINTVSGDINIQ